MEPSCAEKSELAICARNRNSGDGGVESLCVRSKTWHGASASMLRAPPQFLRSRSWERKIECACSICLLEYLHPCACGHCEVSMNDVVSCEAIG